MSEVIKFSRKKGYFADFSNFADSSIVYDGIRYKNAEAAWQSLKTLDAEERKTFADCSPGVAKRKGRKVKLRSDWEQVKYQLMVDVCKQKFLQNPTLLQMLLSTGDAEIIEDTTGWHDNIWGNCECERCKNKMGRNLLGKALMEVRELLRDAAK